MPIRILRAFVFPCMGLPVGMPITTMSMPGAMAKAMAMICRTPAPGVPREAMGDS